MAKRTKTAKSQKGFSPKRGKARLLVKQQPTKKTAAWKAVPYTRVSGRGPRRPVPLAVLLT